MNVARLYYPIHIHRYIRHLTLRKLLASYIHRIEGIRAVRSVFEEVFFRLRQFFPSLILMEAVASTSDSSRLNSKDKIIIVLAVEERHKPLLPGKSLVDEQAGDI